jgi:hypothetical protein
MLRFLGSDLSLVVDEVLQQWDGPRLFAGHDESDRSWLVAEVWRSPVNAKWLCAPQSRRALEYVRCGRAPVRDALRHSIDGTVVLVTVERALMIGDHVLLCANLPDDLLPAADWRLIPPDPQAVADPA